MIRRWWGGALEHLFSNHRYGMHLVVKAGRLTVAFRYRDDCRG